MYEIKISLKKQCTNCKRSCGPKSKRKYGKLLCGHCVNGVHYNTVWSAYRRVEALQEQVRLHKLTELQYDSLLDTPNREELYWYNQGKMEWEQKLSDLYTEMDKLLTPLLNYKH